MHYCIRRSCFDAQTHHNNRRDIVHAGCSAVARCYRPRAASRIPLYPNSLHVPLLHPSLCFSPDKTPLRWAAKAMYLNRTVTVGTYGRLGFCSGRIIQYFARIWWCCLSRALASAANETIRTASPGSTVRHFRLCKKRKNVFKSGRGLLIKKCIFVYFLMFGFVLNSCYWYIKLHAIKSSTLYVDKQLCLLTLCVLWIEFTSVLPC